MSLKGKYVTKKQSDTLYKTMKFIHDEFTTSGIKYFLVGGSLLGAVRNSGLIPYDDDGDVCIMIKDVPKVKRLIKRFEKKGYNISLPDEDNKEECSFVRSSCSFFIYPKKPRNALAVDVFIMKFAPLGEDKKGKITYADPKWESDDRGGKKCFFMSRHVFPLVPIRFGNFFMYAPNNPILHLNSCYGKDWNSKMMLIYNHRTGKWEKKTKHNMKPEDFSGIPPPRSTKNVNPPKMCISIDKC